VRGDVPEKVSDPERLKGEKRRDEQKPQLPGKGREDVRIYAWNYLNLCGGVQNEGEGGETQRYKGKFSAQRSNLGVRDKKDYFWSEGSSHDDKRRGKTTIIQRNKWHGEGYYRPRKISAGGKRSEKKRKRETSRSFTAAGAVRSSTRGLRKKRGRREGQLLSLGKRTDEVHRSEETLTGVKMGGRERGCCKGGGGG